MGDLKDVQCGCAVVTFIWTLVCAGLAIHHLDKVDDDFIDILDSMPNPEIRVVNDFEYAGPVHIICVPSILANYTNQTCDDEFNEFEPITSDQMYFSWLYLDPGSPITDTTKNDILSGRYYLFIFLAFGIFVDIVTVKCCQKIYKYNNPHHDNNTNITEYIAKATAVVNGIFGVNVSHMFLCNLYSITSYSEGLYLLEYVPVYGYWTCFIVFCVMSCCVGMCAAFIAITGEDDKDCLTIIMASLCCFYLIVYILWGFSGYGLFVYIWDFNVNFQAIDIENAIVILKPEYLSSINILRRISIALGVSSIFDVVDFVLDLCK